MRFIRVNRMNAAKWGYAYIGLVIVLKDSDIIDVCANMREAKRNWG